MDSKSTLLENVNKDREGSIDDATSSDEEPGVFSGLSAWFSSSVSDTAQKLWTEHGGDIASEDTALFLFSNDSQAEDTKRIFQSETYVKEHLAFFRADAIPDIIRRKNIKNCAMGMYHLLPKEVEEELRGKVSLIGARKRSPACPKDANSRDYTSPDKSQVSAASHGRASPTLPAKAGVDRTHQTATQASAAPHATQKNDKGIPANDGSFIDVYTMPMVRGEIKDFTVGFNGCKVVSL